MQINEFKSTLQTFIDPGTELLFQDKTIIISVNGESIIASLEIVDGDVFVSENNLQKLSASKWIINRIARLSLLAARLREYIKDVDCYVNPSGRLDLGDTQKDVYSIDDVNNIYKDKSPFQTLVIYLTSDAGEGKTSLINHLAKRQAEKFLDNEADWLFVPIPLGGRHFLRFDDITIGALPNRYRFPFLYYNSFIALVKMGVIVPAFDGFEEMFVESSSGEALSAMRILIEALNSQGAMLIAARKAYYDFENLRMQERYFDSIRNYSVEFGKIELNRWSKKQFIDYCTNRKYVQGEALYTKTCERLSKNHALLTRAVFVKNPVDIALRASSLDDLLVKLNSSGVDFFSIICE